MTRHLVTLASLLALLALTTGLAFTDLGAGNLAAALGIAGIKALLVALVFMDLASANLRLRLTAAAALYWLGLLLGLTIWVSL